MLPHDFPVDDSSCYCVCGTIEVRGSSCSILGGPRLEDARRYDEAMPFLEAGFENREQAHSIVWMISADVLY